MKSKTPPASPGLASRVDRLVEIPWRELEWFQPESIKIFDDKAAAKLARSLVRSGFVTPFHVWKRTAGARTYTIVDGHLRKKALERLAADGVEIPERLPAIVLELPDEAAAKRAVLVFNSHYGRFVKRAALDWLEGFDLSEIAAEIQIPGLSFDFALAVPDGPEEIGEPPAVPVSRLGDVWKVGSQTVLCGDSTRAADVERILAGVEPLLMLTDPPYGVSYDPSWRNADGGSKVGAIAPAKRLGEVSNDGRADWREAYELSRARVAYVWHGSLASPVVAADLVAAGFEIRSVLTWAKDNFSIGRGNYHWQTEPCLYAVRRGSSASWAGGRTESTLWSVPKLANFSREERFDHGTQKPLELFARPLRNHGPGPVYDPFLGSGTSLAAAQDAGREGYGIEIDPAYVDMAIGRISKRTGAEPVLVETGAPFSEVARLRRRGRK
jgi:DNA modification methylase